ncbi:MAG: carboxypeptidase regulatory-like domain-containing protein [Chthoniobacter sp.]|nr:carboxypeptidase regulatory-like domain-containing protein [Chthoniobacter sp.]
MNRLALSAGLLGSVLVVVLSLVARAAEPAPDPRNSPGLHTAELMAQDKRQMLQIWQAIMEYKKDHGQVPDYLSDLVPQYLPDKAVLVSPVEGAYRRGSPDPKLPCSYSYEFSTGPYGARAGTFHTFKELQMKEFGPVVPILRCFAHDPVVMNVAFSGDYFESKLLWEVSPAAHELMQKLGLGPGFEDGDFAEITVVDDLSGEALPDAEVRLTRRQFHDLALPDRTLKTDAEGKVRVPLGPPPARRLSVTIYKPGYTSPSQLWREGALPVMKTWPMAAAVTVGGVVKDAAGAPLAGATVVVYGGSPVVASVPPGAIAVPPDAVPKPQMRKVEQCTTDAAGRWSCPTVPLNAELLRFSVTHPDAWPAVYDSGGPPPPAQIERQVLLEQAAEFRLEASPVLSGTLLAPDGQPLANELVSVTGSGARVNITVEQGRAVQTVTKLPPLQLVTDAAGRFSTKWSRSGEVRVSAIPHGFALVMRIVKAEPGMKPVELKATPLRKITGWVRDSDGHPILNVRVMFIGWPEAPLKGAQVSMTDSSGGFFWNTAPSDQIGLTFTADGYLPSTEWIPADKKDAVQVELRR